MKITSFEKIVVAVLALILLGRASLALMPYMMEFGQWFFDNFKVIK